MKNPRSSNDKHAHFLHTRLNYGFDETTG